MAGITINTVFTGGAGLPTAASRQEQILALDGLLMWAQADASHVTLSSGIAAFNDVGGGDGVFAADSTGLAALSAGELNGFSASSHTTSEYDRYEGSGFTLPSDSPYSYVAVVKPGDTSVDRSIMGRLGSSTSRALLNITTGSGYGRLYHGTGTHFFTVDPTVWSLIAVAFDGANLKAYVNGSYSTPVAAAGTTSSQPLTLCGYNDASSFDGMLTDAMVFSDDIIGSGDIELIAEHFNALYGTFPIA